MARLGDICTVKSGYAFKSEHFSDEGIPVIRIGNITNDGLSLEDAVCFDEDFWENNSNYRVHPNDILIAMSGATVGKSCLNESNEKLLLNQRVAAITAGNGVNVKYIFHIINSDYFTNYVLQNSAGCAQPNISTKQLMNFEIRDVLRIIQDSIANTLDAVDELITLRKEQLAKLDQLVKSRFIELFGDQETNPYNLNVGKLSDVADIYLGLTHTPTYVEQGRPFLSVRDISSGVIDFSNCHYVTEEEFCSLPNGARPKVGDMLFCRVGTIGKPVIIPENTPEFGTFVSVGYLRKKANVNNYYLKSWMENDYFMRQVYDNVAGASQVNLNTGWLKNFRILIPSMELQEQFATFVEQTDKSKMAIQQSLDKLELLKKSLMQEYFG